MSYKEDSLDKVIGSLGFSFSSLPFRNGDVDIREVTQSADLFLEARFNYFDISSEYRRAATATIDALSTRYSRYSYCLSTTESSLDNYLPRFERLGIGYYDFFALENNAVTRESVSLLRKEKDEGRIKHLGLRWTGDAETLRGKLRAHEGIEYVILPLTVSDFLLTSGRKKCYDVAVEEHVPVIIETEGRERTEGSFPEEKRKELEKRHPSWPLFQWNLRFLYSLDGVVTVSMPLDGLDTTKAAIKALRGFSALENDERALLLK